MTGIVLSGGQSTRMGTDKGLMTTAAGAWAKTAADTLSAWTFQVFISVNQQQRQQYLEVAGAYPLIMDKAELEVKGPLLGILSCHRQYTGEDLLVMACDMPFMDSSILLQLTTAYKAIRADAYVFSNEGHYEPLCAIYTAAALYKIDKMLCNHQLAKHSMKYVLEQLNCYVIPLGAEQKKSFVNLNTPLSFDGL